MAAAYGAVSVISSATLIFSADNSRIGAVIYNNGANTVYIGFDSTVSTITGIPLLPQSSTTDSGAFGNYKGTMYGINVSGNSDVRYMTWTR